MALDKRAFKSAFEKNAAQCDFLRVYGQFGSTNIRRGLAAYYRHSMSPEKAAEQAAARFDLLKNGRADIDRVSFLELWAIQSRWRMYKRLEG